MEGLRGLEYLKRKEISGKKCDLSKNFAFISYAHYQEDEEIVKNVFNKLYEKGYNLWIDIANIPKDENSWKKAAQDALMNDEETCKVALFFRSEESLIREPINDELEMIKALDYIHKIITIDIWQTKEMTTDKYIEKLIKEKKKDELNTCKSICEKVNKDNSAYRFQDVGHDLDELVESLEEELKNEDIAPSHNREGEVTFSPHALQAEPVGKPIPPAPDSVPGQVREWIYSTKKGANAYILWDGRSKNCKVLKESVAAKEADKFATSASAAKKLKDQLVSQGILNGLTFIEDYDCDKIATMINLLNGGSVSMPAEIKGRNLVPIEDGGNSANDISLNAGADREASVPEPETLAETDSQPSGECVYIYKNARIRCDLNANVCTVLKGSKTQGESPKFATNAQGAKKLKEELKQKRIIENDVFLEDYTDSMAKLLNLINGGSVSAPREKMKFMRES